MKTWKSKDKSNWPVGVWQDEPDKAQWVDEESGLDCLIVRGPSGSLCGYVGVPESHNCFKKDYYDVEVDVHGGLTFSDLCSEPEKVESNVCHTGEVANDIVWWLGFDTAHSEDYTPKHGFHQYEWERGQTYKTLNYVKREVTSLAKQLGVIL